MAYCIFILFWWSLYCPFFTSSFSGRNYKLLKSRLFVLFRSAFPASCCTYEQVFNILFMNKWKNGLTEGQKWKCSMELRVMRKSEEGAIWTKPQLNFDQQCEWCIRGTVRRPHVLPKDWVEMWGGAELDDLLASYEIFQSLVPWTRYSVSVITLFFCPFVLCLALLVYYWVLSLQAKWSNQALWDRSSFIIWEPKVRTVCFAH